MAKSKLLPAKLSNAKLVPWDKIAPRSVFPLSKGSRAGVVIDRDGAPHLFVFDTFALLDLLSEIDDKLLDCLSPEKYNSKLTNPAGWLIDSIEAKLPLDRGYIRSLTAAIIEADKKGWVPFEKIERELDLISGSIS